MPNAKLAGNGQDRHAGGSVGERSISASACRARNRPNWCRTVLDEICDAAARGETVKLSSFGSFVVRSKGQRIGRNPEDRSRSADPAAPRDGVQAVQRAEGAHQRRRRRRRQGSDGAARGRGLRLRRDGQEPRSLPHDQRGADDLDLPQHVLRFWETRFPQIRPLKRGGGRRYYRPDDVELLRAIKRLLYDEGYTIKGVQKLFREQGAQALAAGAGDARCRRRGGRAPRPRPRGVAAPPRAAAIESAAPVAAGAERAPALVAPAFRPTTWQRCATALAEHRGGRANSRAGAARRP